MNRPPFLTQMTTKRTRRPERNLTAIAPGVSGAVLFPAISNVRALCSRARLCRARMFLVKNVRNSLCNLSCTKVFTPVGSKLLKETHIEIRISESSGGRTTKTGGSDPTFWALNRPKGSHGSLPPVFRARKEPKHPETQRVAPAYGSACAEPDDLNEFRIKACIAGPQKGEPKKCQS